MQNHANISKMDDTVTEAIRRYEQRRGCHFRFDALLSDMDGVLYDSMKYHAAAWAATMQGEGIECTPDEFYMHEGRTGKATINIYFTRDKGREANEEETARIYAEKARRFVAFGKADPVPGAQKLMRHIKAAGIKTVLVTGSGQRSLLDKIEADYPGIFTPGTMVTAFDVKKGKPDAEPYLMGLKKGGVQACNAAVLENAPLGVEAGVAAGIFTIAVNTGPLPDTALYEAGADLVFPDMESLYRQIDKIITYNR